MTKDEAFKELITLYDNADDLENEGEPDKAQTMRDTLDKVGAFIQNLKET